MRFPSLFKAADVTITTTTTTSAAPPWRWRICVSSPKTLSFRATTTGNILKTTTETTPDPSFRFFEHDDEEISSEENSNLETAVVSGLRSERLFFEPGETKSILEEAKHQDKAGISEECVEMDSFDPVLDFRVSMEEMVEAHAGPKDWQFLEELLACYLRVNDTRNRCYIVEAFADMLIHLSTSSLRKENRRHSFTSPLSFTSSTASPSLSLPEKEDRKKNGAT